MQSCVMKTNRKIDLSLYFTSGYVSINHTDSQGFFDFNLLIYKYLRHFTYVWPKPVHNDCLANGCLAENSFLFPYVTFLGHKCFSFDPVCQFGNAIALETLFPVRV
ncbi:hypothetical protein KsCSTR_30900 [Candidatus Kuenenia stuttgartiensis]|nr:hypothetical protein KsCSTR_30900 [Candidatus Kuenenia stuttgartiensis]SOH02766.1 hypothetical protein KSMBR1_0250 [Candidatus Kuenenia stuttgartiensis]